MQDKIITLAVDDEQIVLDSIKKHLRSEEDLQIITVQSVSDAIAAIDSQPVGIILTDLMMPEIDGLEFIELLKKKNSSAVVIMITGYATINTAMQAMQLGAFDYIAKPFTKEELKKVVKRAADLIRAAKDTPVDRRSAQEADLQKDSLSQIKGIGEHSWLVMQDDGTVLIGVERALLIGIGRIQTVYLPSAGDEIRQGSTFFQLFSSDLRSHNLQSPLSGTVLAVNEKAVVEPAIILRDPYGEGWLIRIEPSQFEEEVKLIGLL